jgi:hypothetical protein
LVCCLVVLQLEACVHPFFDELRDPTTRLPNGRPLPPLFNFKSQGKFPSVHHGAAMFIWRHIQEAKPSPWMNVFQLPQQLSLPQKKVASILWFSHLNSIWNCFSLCSASVFLPLIIYKSVSFRQSSQAYRPILSTGSFQSMLVNRTYSWRCTPRNCCRNLVLLILHAVVLYQNL